MFAGPLPDTVLKPREPAFILIVFSYLFHSIRKRKIADGSNKQKANKEAAKSHRIQTFHYVITFSTHLVK